MLYGIQGYDMESQEVTLNVSMWHANPRCDMEFLRCALQFPGCDRKLPGCDLDFPDITWNFLDKVSSNPDAVKLDFQGYERIICESNKERPKQKLSKSSKRHPSA